MASKKEEEKILKRLKKERNKDFDRKTPKELEEAKKNSDFVIRRKGKSFFKHKSKEALESAKKDKKKINSLLKKHKKNKRRFKKISTKLGL